MQGQNCSSKRSVVQKLDYTDFVNIYWEQCANVQANYCSVYGFPPTSPQDVGISLHQENEDDGLSPKETESLCF